MGPEIEGNPGHYHKHQGSLYSVELDGTVVKRLKNVSISNGLTWSLDNKTFYYVDTYKFAVEAYDFDIVSGKLGEYYVTRTTSTVVLLLLTRSRKTKKTVRVDTRRFAKVFVKNVSSYNLNVKPRRSYRCTKLTRDR